jgi:hypothetical protein
MPQILAGIVVSSSEADVVVLSVEDENLSFLGKSVFKVQTGGRAEAYRVLQEYLTDYLQDQKVAGVYVQASAVNRKGTTLGHLHSAELRGVCYAAAASACATVTPVNKGVVSRKFGERKVDEYVADSDFWKEHGLEAVPKGMRPAAFLVVCSVLNQ